METSDTGWAATLIRGLSTSTTAHGQMEANTGQECSH